MASRLKDGLDETQSQGWTIYGLKWELCQNDAHFATLRVLNLATDSLLYS